jgi:hypothetical protein
MHPQLHEIIDELKSAQTRLHALRRTVSDEQWEIRPDPGHWSVSEHVEHLNLTSEVYLEPLREAIEETRRRGGAAPMRYRRDPMGWLLWRTMPPPVRLMRVKARPAFIPPTGLRRTPREIRDRFDRLQHELISLTASADGLPIDRTMIPSPVDPRARYNLFAALGIVPRHQHRHLWHAEKALAS